MQSIQLILIAAGLLVGAAWIATRGRDLAAEDRPLSRALLGLIPGVIGAVIILVAFMDLLPDDLEDSAWTVSIVAISAIAIIGTSYRLARR